MRIYKKYGDASISVVKNQPYRLAADVRSISFLTADKIAQSVGIPHDSPERVKAGLQYALSQATDQGHCYLPEEKLIADAVKLLQVDTGLVIECLGELAAEPEDPDGDPGVVRRRSSAPRVADPVTRRVPRALPPCRAGPGRAAPPSPSHTDEDRMPGFAGRGLGQGAGMAEAAHGCRSRARAGGRRQARAWARRSPVLTGGPGCGKSFTAVHRGAAARGQEGEGRLLRSHPPTSAARLADVETGAGEVHRRAFMLELKPGGDAPGDQHAGRSTPTWCWWWTRRSTPIVLANKLAKAVRPRAHLLLVGDDVGDQLR